MTTNLSLMTDREIRDEIRRLRAVLLARRQARASVKYRAKGIVERMTNSGEIGTGPYRKSADDVAEEEGQRLQDEHEASLHPRERW